MDADGKAIEHWDEYQALTTQSAIERKFILSAPYKLASIMVPTHGQPFWEKRQRDELFKQLKKEFTNHGLTLPDELSSMAYTNYSDEIYKILETSGLKPDASFPEKLTEAIFRFSFPAPITDPELYSVLLAIELAKIKPQFVNRVGRQRGSQTNHG